MRLSMKTCASKAYAQLRQALGSKRLNQEGAPIYPTLTYPAHHHAHRRFSGKHGIVNNEQEVREVSSTWEFFNDAVKVKDLMP